MSIVPPAFAGGAGKGHGEGWQRMSMVFSPEVAPTATTRLQNN